MPMQIAEVRNPHATSHLITQSLTLMKQTSLRPNATSIARGDRQFVALDENEGTKQSTIRSSPPPQQHRLLFLFSVVAFQLSVGSGVPLPFMDAYHPHMMCNVVSQMYSPRSSLAFLLLIVVWHSCCQLWTRFGPSHRIPSSHSH